MKIMKILVLKNSKTGMKQTATERQPEPGSTGLAFTISDKLIEGIIAFNRSMGATFAPYEVVKQRKEICKGCDRSGKVFLKFLRLDGCTECGCPFATKLKFKTHFSIKKGLLVQTKCPIDKW